MSTDEGGRWSVRRLAILLYPFAAGAVFINVFLIGLMGQAIGLTALSPLASVVLGAIFGVPATIWCARRLRALMDEADGR